jgi:CIC family chloride channel protein
VKTFATAMVVGAGASGGVFTPSLFVGAAFGAAVGACANHFAPHSCGDYGGYALVGMGCLVAGTTRAPFMAVMVMFEMTLNYEIVLPLMLGCMTASLVARSLYKLSVYEEGLASRGRTTPQGIEETVLATTRVEDVMRTNPTWVARTATYGDVVPLITVSRATAVYVCGENHAYLGMIRIHDVIQLASLGDLGPGIIALDLATAVEPVRLDQTLTEVFDAMEAQDIDELPVAETGTRKLLGCVTRRDVMAALHVEVLNRHNLRAKFVRRDDEGAAHTDYVALPKGVEVTRLEPLPGQVGRTLGDAAIRANWKVMVLFVVREDDQGNEMRILPEASMKLEEGDKLIVLGGREDLERWRSQAAEEEDA